MKHKICKIVGALLMATVLFSFANNVGASETKVNFKDAYLLFSIWEGQGDATIEIGEDFLTKDRNLVNYNEFEDILLDGKSLNKENYDITSENEKNEIVKVSLKEKYLKLLKDGAYNFDIVFEKVVVPTRLYVVNNKTQIKDLYFDFSKPEKNGEIVAQIDTTVLGTNVDMNLFKNILNNGKIINTKDYKIVQKGKIITVTFSKAYANKIPVGTTYYYADFYNVQIGLKVTKGPKKVTGFKTTRKKSGMKISWKKQKNVTGYVIKISKDKKFKKNVKTIKVNGKQKSKLIKKIKKGKYFLKIKSYVEIGGKKYYSEWSKSLRK